MKLRIQRRPSLTGNPDVYWYYSQIKRFGIWVNCYDDPILTFKYSSSMMNRAYDMHLNVVEDFVQHVLRGEEMYPTTKNTVISEYET
jgi:hypothetical protein